MSKLLKAVEGFIEFAGKSAICDKTELHYSDGLYRVVGRRSKCNTHWSDVHIEPIKNTNTAERALDAAYAHTRALIANEDARALMRTAIKRVYDAAATK